MSVVKEWKPRQEAWYKALAAISHLNKKIHVLQDEVEGLRKDLELALKHSHTVGSGETGPAVPPRPRTVMLPGRVGIETKTVYD